MSDGQAKDSFNEGAQEHAGVLAFYRTLPKDIGAWACIFDRGDYYSVHGETARLAAAVIFQTNAVIKKRGYGDNQVDTVFLNRTNFESFVRELLLVRQYRVSIYRQQTANKNDWVEEFKASPGNLCQLEDVLFGGSCEQSSTAGIMAVKVAAEGTHKVVGVGFVDASSHVLRLCQFTDTEVFSNLEALIVQLGPKECLLPCGEAKSKVAKNVERSGVLVTERKKTEFTGGDATQDLSRLVRGWGAGGAVVAGRGELQQREHAVAALSAAIRYLELTSNEGNFNQFSCSVYDLSQYMRLDSAALKALHVESNSGGAGDAQLHNGTLLAVLDKCKTGPGHRMMAQWLRQPLLDVRKITERQDLVSALVSCVELRQGVSEQLRRVPDLSRIAVRLARKQATLQDCHRLYQCCECLPVLCEVFARYEGDHSAALSAIFTTPMLESMSDLSKFQEMIDTTVDLDQAKRGQYVIKPDFDEELSEIRGNLDSLCEQMNCELHRAASDLCLDAGKTVKLEHNGQYGYFFRVTLKEEKAIRNNHSYQMLDTNKGGVRFRNNRLTDLSREHSEQVKVYEKQQSGVVGEILNIAGGYVEVIQALCHVLTTLDCITALAAAAVSAPVPYVRPVVMEANTALVGPEDKGTATEFSLRQVRHPCLELQDGVAYIANDVILGGEHGTLQLVTGPNMGGKSTHLRSVATAVLLAQVGSFVPASEACLPVVDAILARVGASDCLQKGVSTFMAEMLDTSSILKTATPRSLIIIDELGRGTSTYDGFGLAWAIADHIARQLRSYCLFATHFHELTALADELAGSVSNVHVAAATADDTLTLLYQVRPGACDRSFGIHCAKLAHFPMEVVEHAKRKAEELEDDFGDGDDSAAAVKARRKQKKEGEELIASTLQHAYELVTAAEELDNARLEEALVELRDEVAAHGNPYITSLLATTVAS